MPYGEDAKQCFGRLRTNGKKETASPPKGREAENSPSQPGEEEVCARMGGAKAPYSAGTVSSRSSTSVEAAVFEIGM